MHFNATLYLEGPSAVIGLAEASISRAAMRQSCCVLNSSVVTVEAAPVVANVNMIKTHMMHPFLVEISGTNIIFAPLKLQSHSLD
jgi:hypothetical protein